MAAPATLPTLVDVARGATLEWLFNPLGLGVEAMQTDPTNVFSLVRKPTGFIPLAMSLSAIGLVVVALAFVPPTPQPHDEDAFAHLFQLLMVGQLPFLLFFAGKWLFRDWKAALSVLALQIAGICAAVLPVFLMDW